jgi:hypothetical protein
MDVYNIGATNSVIKAKIDECERAINRYAKLRAQSMERTATGDDFNYGTGKMKTFDPPPTLLRGVCVENVLLYNIPFEISAASSIHVHLILCIHHPGQRIESTLLVTSATGTLTLEVLREKCELAREIALYLLRRIGIQSNPNPQLSLVVPGCSVS